MVLCPILLPTLFQMVAESETCSSDYFQAQKFLVPQIQEKIRQIASPMDAALEGRTSKIPLRSDWEEVKDDKCPGSSRMKFSHKIQKSKGNCWRQRRQHHRTYAKRRLLG